MKSFPLSASLAASLSLFSSLAVAQPAPATPVKDACTDGCHEDVANEYPKHKDVKCLECHPAQSKSYRNSFHRKATKLGTGLAATCADCTGSRAC